MLVDEVFDAVEVLLLPPVGRDTTHGFGGFGEVRWFARVIVIQVLIGGKNAIIGHSGKRSGGVTGVSRREPIEGVRQVFADAEAKSALAGCNLPLADDVALGTDSCSVPARLVFGVPHVVVIVVNSHGEEVLGSSFDVEIHEMFRVPA